MTQNFDIEKLIEDVVLASLEINRSKLYGKFLEKIAKEFGFANLRLKVKKHVS